jgi:ribonuclease Z
MYGEEEKFPNAKKNKHMMIREAAVLARDAGAAELWLTHYSPALVHPENYLEEAEKIFPNTKCGKDGMSVELNFEGEEEPKETQTT